MPRPNLSELFSKFIYRETLSSGDKSDIRGDIGAEAAGAAAAAQAAAIAASQPLAAGLTSYAGAANAAARRALIGALATPVEMTAALPEDGSYALSELEMDFGGVNSDMLIVQDDDGGRIFVEFYEPTGIFSPPPVATWNADTRTLRVSVNPGLTTAALVEDTCAALGVSAFTVTFTGDGSGIVSAYPLTGLVGGNPGTAGVLGQSAIVTHSGTTAFPVSSISEWACVNDSPFRWLPRTAGILRKPDTGVWWRAFIAADGTVEHELLPDQ